MSRLIDRIVLLNAVIFGKITSQVGKTVKILAVDEETFELVSIEDHNGNIEILPDAREMTCEDYYDELQNRCFFDNSIQEIKTLDEQSATDRLMEEMLLEAKKKEVFLKDLNDFDYDRFFFNIIKNYRQ